MIHNTYCTCGYISKYKIKTGLVTNVSKRIVKGMQFKFQLSFQTEVLICIYIKVK